VQSITWSRRQPGNEAVSMRVIYSESEEAAASSASMLGTPMIHTSLPLPPSMHARDNLGCPQLSQDRWDILDLGLGGDQGAY